MTSHSIKFKNTRNHSCEIIGTMWEDPDGVENIAISIVNHTTVWKERFKITKEAANNLQNLLAKFENRKHGEYP